MAKRTDFDAEFEEAVALARQVEKPEPTAEVTSLSHERSVRRTRRVEVMSLRLAGLTYDQIVDRLGDGTTIDGVRKLVERSLERSGNRRADEMRALENERLDRVQAAIWPQVLQGDTRAVYAFIALSNRRAKMNGLDAPKQIALSVNVRAEMEQALDELQKIVLGEVIEEAADDG